MLPETTLTGCLAAGSIWRRKRRETRSIHKDRKRDLIILTTPAQAAAGFDLVSPICGHVFGRGRFLFIHLPRIMPHMHTIVQVGHPALRSIAKEIPLKEIGSSRIREIISDMKALLAKEEFGVAIAAPQVGESVRMFVVAGAGALKRKRNGRKKDDEEADDSYFDGMPETDEVYINPVLVKTSRGKKDKHEGCLSVRGKWGEVPRAEKATVRAYNEKGEKIERGASGFLAHIFQHEMEHLDGILYTDKATEIYDDPGSTAELATGQVPKNI